MNRSKAVLLLGAGYGTRLMPVTEYIPKPLFSVNGQSLLARHLEQLKSLDLPIFINIAYHCNAMVSYLVSQDLDLRIIYEVEPSGVMATLKRLNQFQGNIEQFLLISSDLYINDYQSLLETLDSQLPTVFVDSEGNYGGVCLLNHCDIERQSYQSFKDFFKMMRRSYKIHLFDKPTYNVGSLSIAESI